jgi:hypothetical protein
VGDLRAVLMTPPQCRAARALLDITQTGELLTGGDNAIRAMRQALQEAGSSSLGLASGSREGSKQRPCGFGLRSVSGFEAAASPRKATPTTVIDPTDKLNQLRCDGGPAVLKRAIPRVGCSGVLQGSEAMVAGMSAPPSMSSLRDFSKICRSIYLI